MSYRSPNIWLAAFVGALTATPAVAQSDPPKAPTSMPLSAGTAGAPYRSAMDGYQPFSETKLLPWKEANDTVGKIGGWRAYAKEARDPEAKDGPAPAAKPADPHAGHEKK